MAYDPEADPKPERGGAYDYRGGVTLAYAPESDGEPDPGEVVWAWVPYEEDPHQGKDRPVAVLGTADDSPGDYVVLMVSSRNHEGDRGWVGIGSGGWDRERRDSYVRCDRLLAVSPDAVRREGAALSEQQYALLRAEFEDGP